MHYDVVIIGAGMSGLAAGIRLAYFDKRVCIVERHYAFGGLNSYYTLHGREFDVGLHAVTNYVPEGVRAGPLPKLLRQLRLTRDDFDLRPQKYSEVRFPGRRMRFTNDIAVLTAEVAREFPHEADGFVRLVEAVRAYDDTRLDHPWRSTRAALAEFLRNQVLIDMLLCPIMYYGSAEEHDMDFTSFVILFKSILLEGFARPRGGVRTIIRTLVRRFRACGGKLRMRCGVERIEVRQGRVAGLTLSTGEAITADVMLSSAGHVETMRMCGAGAPQEAPATSAGRVSFVESIAVLDVLPQQLGHGPAIVFFNEAETFSYARPEAAVDERSGVVCCPSNYEGHEDMAEGLFRVTWLANPEPWMAADESKYAEMKQACQARFLDFADRWLPGARSHVRCVDLFTPRTIERFTGHVNGAVYGAPRKCRDGRTGIEHLYLIGTDQGYLGIVGAMLSGITMANMHVLGRE